MGNNSGNKMGVCLEEMDKQVNQTSGGGGSASHGFSEQQIADALRGALEQGVRYAVELASEAGGFATNELIKIPFPENEVESKLREVGAAGVCDKVIEKLNESAEKAAVKAIEIFVQAIKMMSVDDAAKIIKDAGSGDDAGSACTKYLIKTCRTPIINEMRPVVVEVLNECGLTLAWDGVKAAWDPIPSVPYVWDKPSIPDSIDEYALEKAADGLFLLCQEKEKEIRFDVTNATSELVQAVFKELAPNPVVAGITQGILGK